MKKIEIKIVMIHMMDGNPGEFSFYRESLNLEKLDLPGTGLEALYLNDAGVLALVAGVGSVNTAVSLMALGVSEQFDFSQSYWLVAGVAGANPHTCSLGSAVWVDWSVDGDLAYEVDGRELPSDWSTGIIPLGAREPYGVSTMDATLLGRCYQVFRLNPSLCAWAYELTRNVQLEQTKVAASYNARYVKFPHTRGSPKVIRGDNLSTSRFWYGVKLNTWAERWVERWTGGEGRFVTASMEDTGTLHAIRQLERMGWVDYNRVLLLRSTSNYTLPPPDVDLAESLQEESIPALECALENGFKVGSVVIANILENWSEYQSQIPAARPYRSL